jgi:hypothetical protein
MTTKHQTSHWLDYVPRIEDFSRKLRAYQFDKSVVIPLLYLLASALFIGLFIWIFYIDGKDRMADPDSQEAIEEEMRKELAQYEEMSADDLLAGKLPNSDDSIIFGKTEKYEWQQSGSEVELFIPLSPLSEPGRRDIKVLIKSRKLTVEIFDQEYIAGQLYAEVDPDECNWQIDTDDNGYKQLWISLYKKARTDRKSRWKCVIQGHVEIGGNAADLAGVGASEQSNDNGSNGNSLPPDMIPIDVSDEAGMKAAIDNARARAAAKKSQ